MTVTMLSLLLEEGGVLVRRKTDVDALAVHQHRPLDQRRVGLHQRDGASLVFSAEAGGSFPSLTTWTLFR